MANREYDAMVAAAAELEARMRETGRAVLYLADKMVTNWPGTLRIEPRHIQVRRHSGGFGGQRTDVWFCAFGSEWHGVNRGDNQLLRCKRVRARNAA